jgi:hypothetical protein
MDAVAATVAEPAQLLDIDMDQLPGLGPFLAADRLAGRAVQPGQPLQPMPAQHPVDGRGRQPDQRCDPGRTELAGSAQRHDPRFELGGVRRGWWWAQLGRSRSPAGPAWRQRAHQR